MRRCAARGYPGAGVGLRDRRNMEGLQGRIGLPW